MSDYVADLQSPHAYRRNYAQGLGESFCEATVEDGVVRWKSSGRVPPADICALWAHLGKPFDPEKSASARDAEFAAFAAEYRRHWRPPTDEERFEMRAAGLSGPVVDVLAGRTFSV